MKPIWIVILVISLAGNLIGGYILYKALNLRAENSKLNRYLDDLAEKNRELKEDYPGLSVFAAENKALLDSTTADERKEIVILYGASITNGWDTDSLLPGYRIVKRGIGSQSSTQLLARFSGDVLALHPGQVAVKICAGNYTPSADPEMIWNEFETMVLAARDRGIEPVVTTMVPVTRAAEEYDGYSITDEVKKFNRRARSLADRYDLKLIDYYGFMADDHGYLPDELARDAIHPNDRGYEKMTEAFRAAFK